MAWGAKKGTKRAVKRPLIDDPVDNGAPIVASQFLPRGALFTDPPTVEMPAGSIAAELVR